MVGCADAIPDKVLKEIKISESDDDEDQTSKGGNDNDSEQP